MNQIANRDAGPVPKKIPTPFPKDHPQAGQADAAIDEMIEYYEEAGPDYAAWSPEFNMHFGYFAIGMNPFRREAMLARMNDEVFDRLDFDDRPGDILDAGCGLGTPARAAARRFANANVTGISIVPWQIEQARSRALADFADPNDRAAAPRFERMDFTRTDFPDAAFDRVYGIESVCHAPGLDKGDFLTEAARILKPGGRLVIADGFLKQAHRPMPGPLDWITRTICRCWSLETFAGLKEFRAALIKAGFGEPRIEDLSWRIAPSVLHVPAVTARFLLKELRSGAKLTKQRRENLIAPMLAPLLGMARSRFAYLIVTAERR
ncbi:MAG: methyltransferase domain-containing protein [bacterium]|nr:methyltransferase domain-containing protein [bacterium]